MLILYQFLVEGGSPVEHRYRVLQHQRIRPSPAYEARTYSVCRYPRLRIQDLPIHAVRQAQVPPGIQLHQSHTSTHYCVGTWRKNWPCETVLASTGSQGITIRRHDTWQPCRKHGDCRGWMCSDACRRGKMRASRLGILSKPSSFPDLETPPNCEEFDSRLHGRN